MGEAFPGLFPGNPVMPVGRGASWGKGLQEGDTSPTAALGPHTVPVVPPHLASAVSAEIPLAASVCPRNPGLSAAGARLAPDFRVAFDLRSLMGPRKVTNLQFV